MLFKIISCIIKLYERGFTMAKLDNFLIQLFHEGNCLEMYKVFGAHLEENDGDKGCGRGDAFYLLLCRM